MTLDKTFVTPKDLAKAAADGGRPVTVQHVRNFIRAGQIPARRVSGVWVIGHSAAMQWLEQWLADKP